MPKIHLLMKKEDIDQQKLSDNKLVVVFDILLATTTITAALEFGAKEVIPVLNGTEAKKAAEGRIEGSYLLVGEYEGATLEGFLSPNPMGLKEIVSGKTIILSTTNGTVALKNSEMAKRVYAASILNSKAVAQQLRNTHQGESIILICSGSSGEFNIEDFIGAGYFIDCLLTGNFTCELTDAANAAYQFYLGSKGRSEEIIKESNVGQMLTRYGFEEALTFVSKKSVCHVVPVLLDKSVVDEKRSVESIS